MKTKILNIAIIMNNNKILMRKKPEGSPPYKETWYLFGGEVKDGVNPEDSVIEIVKIQTGLTIKLNKNISWATELKKDLDGEQKQFIYLNSIFDYVGGDLILNPDQNIEKLEWIHPENFGNYDIVPPSMALFEELGYITK